jgi:hypothetical protein
VDTPVYGERHSFVDNFSICGLTHICGLHHRERQQQQQQRKWSLSDFKNQFLQSLKIAKCFEAIFKGVKMNNFYSILPKQNSSRLCYKRYISMK